MLFYNKLNVLSNKKLKEYVLSDWLDAKNSISPMYIKVTGHGSEYPYTAYIDESITKFKNRKPLTQIQFNCFKSWK